MKQSYGIEVDQYEYTAMVIEATSEEHALIKLGLYLKEQVNVWRYHNGPTIIVQTTVADQMSRQLKNCWEIDLKDHAEYFYVVPDSPSDFPVTSLTLK